MDYKPCEPTETTWTGPHPPWGFRPEIRVGQTRESESERQTFDQKLEVEVQTLKRESYKYVSRL